METSNLKFDKKLVREGDFSYISGFEKMSELIKLDNPPTAVFCDSDQMAIGAIKAIRNHGFNVPDDFAVVGFDNIEIVLSFLPDDIVIHLFCNI